MTGVLISVAVASYIALQAARAGAALTTVVPAAAGVAGILAAFWTLAVETLFPKPDFWGHVLESMGVNFAAAVIGAACFTWAAGRLIGKITDFKEKHPNI
ncbi:MAG: hypothetical protein AAF416_08570 [Pseudomonadota bacterium]